MNAIEFVKKFGIKEAKDQLENPKLVYGAQVDYQFMNDLKQIIDAFELVESFGGLFQAKVALYKEGFTGGIEFGEGLIEDDVLKQAIELVEQCNES